ncbi:thioredoxin-dependent thiol peroxidase [Bifidobacterium saguini DSM 23967]|uniref:thioredoxin-dependent peroxiredoxin n=2 Tax=Bifidobacterium saguini TaxID=762210 RepID=A0A087D9V9_9BIFI|nr:peroxiredoxin [Bifidobacterium saguini]KFI92309.1 thioredoxin-dependent thiol peroxidase [Bifidobacterium saguini DSM 23967]QTB91011.1 peroxiredoxin [Bifidobacterium saguini]
MGAMTNTEQLTESTATHMPARLEAGEHAPDFTLLAVNPDGSESEITLSELTAQGKSVILYFYPAAMTPGCTTEACDFRDNMARLGALGYTVLGVSKDPVAKLQKFRERDHLSFPLLSDPDLTAHKLYAAYGEKKLYGKTHVGVLRSTFAINAQGVIELARYNVRAKGHVESLLKKLG